jgi:crossover junction endodeoxyribonuclease RuvC
MCRLVTGEWFCQNAAVGITPQQFESMQQRLQGKRHSAEPVMKGRTMSAGPACQHQIVLGIDPSLRGTGYCIVQKKDKSFQAITYGTVKCSPTLERSRCLVRIAETLRDVIKKHHPTACAIEGLFFAQNLQTALIMGEARGACLLCAGEGGMEIYEIAPRKVKQAIVGYGAAQKLAVAKMVQRMLHLTDLPDPDAADALALALAFLQETSRLSLTPSKRI